MCERTDTDATDAIEITAEMIAAGVSALVSFNPKFEAEEDGVIRIYRAMVMAAERHK